MNREDKIRQVERAFEVLYDSAQGFVELRQIDPCGDEPPVRNWYSLADRPLAVQKVVDQAASLEGKFNSYVGRAPRSRAGGGTDADVDFVYSVSIDIDPKRPKGQPATASERYFAKDVATALRDHVRAGVLVSSGNGFQLWIPLVTALDIRGRREWWKAAHKAWEARVLQFSTDPDGRVVQIDPQFDIPRVVALPGFLKVKGEEDDAVGRWYKDAEIDTSEVYNCYDVESILKFAPAEAKVDAGAKRANLAAMAPIPAKFWRLLNEDPRLYESYNGERRDLSDPSNSTQNMALVNRLKYHGFTRDEAAAVLSAAPSLKQRATDYYLNLTLGKVYGE